MKWRLRYARLFKLDPSLRPLFTGDMRRQGKKLMDMLATVVRNLDKLDRIIPSARALGQRHVAYGVREEHYDIVGAALLWTLEEALGEAWTVDLACAWVTAYTLLAGTMKAAAAEMEAVAV
jgi:hemoglobin-like flavoprotein